MNTISWTTAKFEKLTAAELYEILQLRAEVFVVEQNCPYQDLDGKDSKAIHLMGRNASGKLIAYARLLAPGISYEVASIGRVVSSPSVRGFGAGKELMETAIRQMEIHFGAVPIRIGAQEYLKKFYESFGFVQVSGTYLEDNIPHIEMLLS